MLKIFNHWSIIGNYQCVEVIMRQKFFYWLSNGGSTVLRQHGMTGSQQWPVV